MEINVIEPTDDKMVDVEKSDEDTKSLFNECWESKDNDFDNMFQSLSDYEDESLDYDIEKYVVFTKAKVREKGTASTKNGKELLVKKIVSKVTGKRKRSKKDVGKGPSLVLNQLEPQDTLGLLERELVLQRRLLL